MNAEAINVHRADGSYVLSLPGDANGWMDAHEGSYYFVATNAGHWSTWGKSPTVTIHKNDSTAVLKLSAEAGVLTWRSPTYDHTINIHSKDGTYITSLASSANRWIPEQPGEYYIVAATTDSWNNWVRSNEVGTNPDEPSYEAPLLLTTDGDALVWQGAPAGSTINVHFGDGDYLSSISSEIASWTPGYLGDFYVVAVTSDDWQTWPRSNTVTLTKPDNQIGHQVNWTITVPAYMSDALQVRLTWGDIEVSAQWVTDETWTASAFIPFAVRNQLQIIFYDRNGEIILGSYETTFQTNRDYSTTPIIYAHKFDTSRWDHDIDGVSNLDELRAGTDPLVHYLEEQPSVELPLVAEDLTTKIAGHQLDQLGLIVEDLMQVIEHTTTIVWPTADWHQVQDSATYTSVCDGGSECKLLPGSYTVINHSTGESYSLDVDSINLEDNPLATALSPESFTIQGEHFITETAPTQRTQYTCENGGSMIKERVDANPAKKIPVGFNYPGKFDRHGYLFDQCKVTLRDGPLPKGTYLLQGSLQAEFRDYYGFDDHIDSHSFDGFSITGDNGLEYRVQGETEYQNFESWRWISERQTLITEYFKKLPGDQTGESITDVEYSQNSEVSHSYRIFTLDANGSVRDGLTGGNQVTISTLATLNANSEDEASPIPFNGLLELRSEDGSTLHIQADPIGDPDDLYAVFADFDFTAANGDQTNTSRVRYYTPSTFGPVCSIVRNDGTRELLCKQYR